MAIYNNQVFYLYLISIARDILTIVWNQDASTATFVKTVISPLLIQITNDKEQPM